MVTKENTLSLKGIAILIVMFGHLVTVNKTPLPAELRWTASFGVTIFLILSGYGLMKSLEINGIKNFFKKRILTVLIPFYIMSSVTFFVNGPSINSLLDLLKTFTFTNLEMNIDPTMWYIYFICVWYVIFYFTARFIKSKNYICILLFLFSSIFVFHNPFIGHENLRFQSSLHAYSFPIGVLLSILRVPTVKFRTIGISLLLVCILIQISQWREYADYKFSISCISFGLGIILIFSQIKFSSPFFAFIGSISYEAYLIEGLNLRYQFSSTWYIDCAMFFIVTMSLAVTLKAAIEMMKGIKIKNYLYINHM